MVEQERVDSDLAAQYQAYGLTVTAPKGVCWRSDEMVCAEHDGVPYCMAAFGKPGKIPHGVTHRRLIIERHHALVKSIYDYCVALGVGDIWVLSSGGTQLQAFFGNRTGYLATLYLDMERLEEQEEAEELLELVGNKSFTLQVNWTRNDPLFEGRFALEGVTLRTSREVFGED